MKIFITGIQGFLGGQLARHFRARGHEVAGSTSRSIRPAAAGRDIIAWRFGDPIEPARFAGVDATVHCAHDFAGSIDCNLEGTVSLAKAARQGGVRKQLYISSLSSRPDAGSRYGQTKFAIEEALAADDLLVVRPGTIIGEGGLFGRMCGMLKTLPIVPLIGGGKDRMYLISTVDTCLAVERILQADPPGAFNLYYEERPALRDVLMRTRRIMNSKAILVPVPRRVVAAFLGIADVVGIRLPVDRDNLRGLVQSQQEIHATDLGSLIEVPQSVDEALLGTFRS